MPTARAAGWLGLQGVRLALRRIIVQRQVGAGPVQPARDRRADPLGRARDEDGFAVQLRGHNLKILPDSRTMSKTSAEYV
jgi:hypothetical protein